MPASFSVNDTALWPTLGSTLEDLSRVRVLNRETLGAAAIARTLDRENGMDRTGAAPRAQALFGGIVGGKNMDWTEPGNFMPRDAILRTDDLRRGMLTLHQTAGTILDTSV